MTNQVLKWVIPVDDDQHIVRGVPRFAGAQGSLKYDEILLWTEAPQSGDDYHKVQVFGTGQPVPPGAVYVWTVLCAGGELVWHLFDVTNVERTTSG